MRSDEADGAATARQAGTVAVVAVVVAVRHMRSSDFLERILTRPPLRFTRAKLAQAELAAEQIMRALLASRASSNRHICCAY